MSSANRRRAQGNRSMVSDRMLRLHLQVPVQFHGYVFSTHVQWSRENHHSPVSMQVEYISRAVFSGTESSSLLFSSKISVLNHVIKSKEIAKTGRENNFIPLRMAVSLSFKMSNCDQPDFDFGIGLFFIHPPHAYWKKSWQGSAVGSIAAASSFRAECVTKVPICHKFLFLYAERDKNLAKYLPCR